jgi:hypothetical protein
LKKKIKTASSLLQVTIPLANLDHHVSLSFVAAHGSDKSLLCTILDTYSLIQEQVVLASKLATAPVTNGDLNVDVDVDASELLKEKVYFQQTDSPSLPPFFFLYVLISILVLKRPINTFKSVLILN